MRYMLDTNICIYIIKKKPAPVVARFKKMNIADIALSSVTLSELEYGVIKSSRPEQNREALTQFLSPFEMLPYDDLAAVHYGEIRAYLEQKGKLIGAMDMLIAAHARSRNLTLVSNNAREFSRIPALKTENWV